MGYPLNRSPTSSQSSLLPITATSHRISFFLHHPTSSLPNLPLHYLPTPNALPPVPHSPSQSPPPSPTPSRFSTTSNSEEVEVEIFNFEDESKEPIVLSTESNLSRALRRAEEQTASVCGAGAPGRIEHEPVHGKEEQKRKWYQIKRRGSSDSTGSSRRRT